MTPESRILAQAIHTLSPIGASLVDAATHLAGIRELLPARGELVTEFEQLVACLALIEDRYHDANDALLDAITELEHTKRVPHPLPLREIA